MKIITVKNLIIQFDSIDEGADQHTATATLDNINVVLKHHYPEINPQIFVASVDADDIEIADADEELELPDILKS